MNKTKGAYCAPKNLSSVHHASFERLHDLTNNYNQAMLLDKLVYWWQISTYTLDDGNIWFTRSVGQIAAESRLSVRTVGRYLKAFTDAGYIEKVNRLHKKKNLYIRVTDKLLFLIGDKKETTPYGAGNKSENQPVSQSSTVAPCVFSEHVGRTGSANLAESIYKEKDYNLNNTTVREPCSVTFGDNGFEEHHPTPETCVEESVIETPKAIEPPKYPTYAVEQEIGERITETTKNYIKGTMRNLKTQYQLEFSNPEQVFSEIVFSLLNTEKQFPGVQDTHHRMNLIAKLMREKRWCTPKGFYNHWDVGQAFKAKQAKQTMQARALKHQASRGETLYPSAEEKVCQYAHVTALKGHIQAYQELKALIATESRYLSTMEARYKRQPNPMNARVIESTAMKLAKLHDQLGVMEMQQEAA